MTQTCGSVLRGYAACRTSLLNIEGSNPASQCIKKGADGPFVYAWRRESPPFNCPATSITVHLRLLISFIFSVLYNPVV